jgi:hypothetical protein
MTSAGMCKATLSIMALLFTATMQIVAQQPSSIAPADKDFLPAGPFLFEPGTVRPTYMDAFDDRPVVKSPDGKFGITATGPKESYAAWVTVSLSASPDVSIRVWPIQASVAVLWRPNSQAFAVTDHYSNDSYVLLCGTTFRMENDPGGLGVPITDLTPIVRKAFNAQVEKYYESDKVETRLFYAIALRWVGSDELLVGISARTVGPATASNQGQKEWDFAYLVDISDMKVIHEVDKEQLLSEYKIKAPY